MSMWLLCVTVAGLLGTARQCTPAALRAWRVGRAMTSLETGVPLPSSGVLRLIFALALVQTFIVRGMVGGTGLWLGWLCLDWMGLLAEPALAFGWIPGGFPVAAVAFIGCLIMSYALYRAVRVRSDAEQVARLREMQQRENMSDEELLSFVALHHPYVLDGFFTTFGARLHDSIKDQKHR